MSGRERYLTASQVAAIFNVGPKTVTRWAVEGRLPHVRTLGGHRKYAESEIRELVRMSYRPGSRA